MHFPLYKIPNFKKNRACGGPNPMYFPLYKISKPQNFRACGESNTKIIRFPTLYDGEVMDFARRRRDFFGFRDRIQGEIHWIWPATGAKSQTLVYDQHEKLMHFSRNCRHVSTINFSHRTASTNFRVSTNFRCRSLVILLIVDSCLQIFLSADWHSTNFLKTTQNKLQTLSTIFSTISKGGGN